MSVPPNGVMWLGPWPSIYRTSLLCTGNNWRPVVLNLPLKDWIHIWIQKQFASPGPFWHLQDITGYLACLSFSACDEASYAPEASAAFDLRVCPF